MERKTQTKIIEINQVVKKAISMAEKQLGDKIKKFRIEPTYELSDYGGELSVELLSKIDSADISIVDISDNNPNVLYELGYMTALKKRSIIIKSKKQKQNYKVPTDIRHRFYLEYDSIKEIVSKLASFLKKRIEFILETPPREEELRKIWFPEHTDTIHVIAPQSQLKTKFSQVKSSNYSAFHRLGDKDAVMDLLLFMSRLYPNTKIVKHVSTDFDFSSSSVYDNMVVIGGPGGDDEIGNNVCREITQRIDSIISYTDDCEKIRVRNKIYPAKLDKAGKVEMDYGYFARINNPFNPHATIILAHGIHTFGVLGAIHAFSQDAASKNNVELILDQFGFNPHFESWFPVEVISGGVITPEITNTRSLKFKRK